MVYRWGNNPRRAELKGRQCIVLARGAMNTILVQFLDTGEKVTTSRRAVRYDRPAGKAALPAKRRYCTTSDVVRGAKGMVKAIGGRVANDDPDDLRHLIALERELRQAWSTAVAGIRRSGFTDREIGQVLGTTRQAVEQRWPREKTS